MVTDSPPSAKQRTWFLLLTLVSFLIGAALAWAGAIGLVSAARDMMHHAERVSLQPRDAIGLPLSLPCLAFAAAGLRATLDIGPARRRMPTRKTDVPDARLGVALVMIAGISLVLSAAIVPITEFGAWAILARHGYDRCPGIPGERHPRMRWVLPGGHCPER